MTQKELLQELSQFVMKAYVGPQNTETGFLTHHHVNSLTKEQATDFLQETEAITRQMVEQMEQSFDGNVPTDYECGVVFQYVFDKTTEAAFKQLTGKDIDTQYYVPEAFEYYEPDLPEYIQLKLTNIVGRLAIISSEVLHYIDEKELKTDDLGLWMPPYLMISAILAINFAQEIDPNDDSEMQDYLES